MALDLERIEKHCRSHTKVREWVREIMMFDRVDSTNRIALEMASQGLPGGIVILAEAQEKGKGRLGREWFSPEGMNLYFSLLLRPYQPARDFPLYSLATSVALIEAIQRTTGLAVQIKWPNDVVLEDKKLAGILLESEVRGEQSPPLVVGVGVNVNIGLTDFPPELQKSATSLRIALGRPVDRADLLIELFNQLVEQYRLVDDKALLIQAVRQHCQTLGRRVRVQTARQEFEGWAEDLQEDGALLIRMGDGNQRRILVGDVTHLREVKDPSAHGRSTPA
ncbi:biotin--[acetyl-CoA-carboxylase] ligase [Candidatus Manganitrophus noduliformans]|uniref:biotin--[biotin carboxyl-carrier protein] ligase n=1 Tax=Candidatus Manganitrophus noduliformans TaxID=2606439 RepID=A0A7X6I9A7_9BACT|nr:biotin--[acetyl-CoA-carboxylase] ligase [Candidatus Manganitrophus noduliformans]NKE69175.1 biotin--[acetyl-CoA-carboxylase] ligase [Candidatus Manganitrophus noduliformans]